MKIYEYVIKIKDQGIDKLRQLANAGSSIRNVFGRIGNNIAGFGRQLRGLGGQITEFLGISAALRFLPAAAITGFALLGTQAVTLAADLEQTTVGFEVMLGSAEKAHRMVANLRQFAKVTPFETTDLVRATEILLGFGVAGEEIMPTIKMLGDASRGNAEKLRLISLAYAQIQAAGRLMGQDLLQLVNAGFNPLQQISAKTGKSMAVLKKEMEDGKISAAMVTEAFRDATSQGGRFFGMMERQSKTFHGMASTLRDEWNEALTTLGFRLLPTAIEALRGLRSVLDDLVNRVDFGPLVASFNDIRNAIAQVMSGMNMDQARTLQTIFNTIAFSIRTTTLPLRVLLHGISLFIDVAGKAVQVGKGFGMVLAGMFTHNFALIGSGVKSAVNAAGEGFDIMKKQISDFARNEGQAYSDIFNTGPKPVVTPATSPFGSQLDSTTPGAGKSGNSADSKVRDGIDKITGGGRQAVNVTINLENLVGVQNFDVTNVKETIQDMKRKVTEALLETLNSANYAVSQ